MDDRHHTHRNANDAADPSAHGALPTDENLSEALLSAYLDGECTASEQALIEEQIAASAELRQLVDELRSVRSHLELLSQYRLEPDFADRVLRRAEQEVLVGGGGWTNDGAAEAATVAPASSASAAAVSVVPSEQERSGRARPFVWTLAALAAAVLILVMNREPIMRPDPIARGPDAPKADSLSAQSGNNAAKDVIPPTANTLTRDLKKMETRADVGEVLSAARPKSGAIAPSIDRRQDDSAANPPADSTPLSEAESVDAGTPSRAKNEFSRGFVEETSARTSAASKSAEDLDADLKLPPSSPSDGREDVKQSPAAQAPVADAPDLDKAKVLLRTEAVPQAADKEIAPQEPIREYSEPARRYAAGVPPAPAADQADASAAPIADENAKPADEPAVANGTTAAKDDAAVSFTAPRESFRVVEVVVERDAWQRKAVETVLANNGIALYDSKATAPAPSGPAAPAAASKPTESKSPASTPTNKPDPQTTSDGLEMMVVSATPAQIEAALGDFGAGEDFQVLRVTDASTPNLLYWQSQQMRNNRGTTWGVRAGQTRSGTAEIPVDRLGAQGAQAQSKAGDHPAQLADQEAGKKLNRELAPDDQKAATEPQAAQPGLPAATKKSRALRDATAQSRRARATPGAAPELRKEDPGAKDSAADKIFLGRGATAENPASGGSAGGVADQSAAEGDAAGTPVSGGATRALGGSGYGGGGLGGYGGGQDAATGRARYAKGGYGRAGYGSAGGGGFGGARPADASAREANLPTGYGQRLTLQHSADLYETPSPTTYQFGVSPEGVLLRTDGAQASPLAPEQILFVFRVVDSPVAKSTIAGSKNNSAATSPVPSGGAESARQGGRANVPVPAPTAPANSAR
jgi:hypothetical protein